MNDAISPIIMSPLFGEVRGALESVLPVEGGDLIASFRCRCPECGGKKTVLIALPGELAPELQPLAGKWIGIMRSAEQYDIRDFSGRGGQ